ncbi:MAG TPA: MHYT domain-containing protein [Rhizomicrobium sp.]|nr:MHYT domain-containing protein [Rhizomicrobium sp.]
MSRVLGCIVDQHDLRLVAVAALLCALASWTSITLLWRARVNGGRFRRAWIAAAAGVFGAGIWATHFVAMLAYRSAVPVGYDFGWTLLSVLVAIGFAYVGFSLVFRQGWAATGGAIAGAGIGAMHYLGMLAFEGPFHIDWDALYAGASFILGIGFGALAALAGTRIRNIRGRVAAAACFMLGICAMHFTGMAAATLVFDPTAPYDEAIVLAPETLAAAIASAALLIVMLGLVGGLLDRHLELRRTGEEARLRIHIAELEATRSDLDLALRDSRAASEAKSSFLSAMSHELRTPLNAIIGFSDFILSKPSGAALQPRQKEYVEEIHKSGLHLLSLINDILDLSRLDARKLELREETVSVSHLLGDAAVAMEADAHKAGVHLSVEAAKLPCIRADERRLKQIVVNLLSNAIKFTPKGGEIRIRAAAAEEGIAIAVSDTGIGIARDDIAKAFERFGQVDGRLARKYEGAGLGLPLAKQLIELHGGTIAIESELGAGTTVTVTLPAWRIAAFQDAVAA